MTPSSKPKLPDGITNDDVKAFILTYVGGREISLGDLAELIAVKGIGPEEMQDSVYDLRDAGIIELHDFREYKDMTVNRTKKSIGKREFWVSDETYQRLRTLTPLGLDIEDTILLGLDLFTMNSFKDIVKDIKHNPTLSKDEIRGRLMALQHMALYFEENPRWWIRGGRGVPAKDLPDEKEAKKQERLQALKFITEHAVTAVEDADPEE